jgi:subtilisin family serine protease
LLEGSRALGGRRARTRGRLLVLIALGLLVGPAAGAARPLSVAAEKPPVVANELIVGFEHTVSSAQQGAAVREAGGTAEKRFSQIDAVLVRVAAGTTERVTAHLVSDPRVRYVEPNYVVTAAVTPNDPSFSQLWGMHNTGQTGGTPDADIDAPEAWNVETGSSNVVVAVTDSGVDFSHPDLAAQQWVNTGENCGSSDPTIVCADRTDGVDDDGNGYVDDWRGWDFVSDDNNPFDDNDHGTHVAGTIGAVGNNGVGVTGVNWNVKIMALKFLNSSGSGSTADAISATLYAANEGAFVANNSWGGGGFSQPLLDAIEYGATRGMLFAAAAGNFSSNDDTSPYYPASYGSDVIAAVAATDHNDARSSFSNYGVTTVDLGAPGSNIYSTIPGGAYAFFNGTSMATPHVAGAAALLKAHFPSATAYGVKALLMRSVDPKASLNGITVTGGRLNLANAVSCVNAPKAVLLTPLAGFSVNVGQSFTIRMLGANCASPAGVGNVSVTVNGTPVAMAPASPDNGRYTGTYTPTAAGPLSVSASVTIGGSSDTQTAGGTAIQDSNYVCQDIGDAWVDVTGGTKLPPIANDGFTTINLPFPFTFYGQTHTQAYVSSNGFLTLGSSANASAWSNAIIPRTATPNGIIAPFWDDLNPTQPGAGIYSGTTGSSPNRVLHLEWFNVPHHPNVGATTFEVSLYESTDEIRLRYLDTDFGNATYNSGRSATAGVENQTGTAGTQYSRNQAVLTNGKTIRCSQGGGPPPPPPPVTITTTSLPGGTVGQPYSQSVTASGGTTPYSWSVVSGSLPPGLSLSPSGTPSATVSGTPTTAGTYNFTVQVTDAAAQTDTQAFSVTISPAATLTITTTSLPNGTVGQAYWQSVTASGGTPPYSWSVSSGTLPPGLDLSPTGTLSGTPTTEGTYDFTIQVADSAAQTDTQAFSVTIAPAAPSTSPVFGSAGAAAAALGTSIDVPYPSGTSANDILLLLVMTRDSADVNTPAGFTAGDARGQNSGLRAEWFWKRATGSETGTLNVTKASGSALLIGRMYRFTGAAVSGTPFEAAAQGGAGSNATITPVDITTQGANRRVVVLVAEGDDQALGDFTGGTATVSEETAEATTTLGTDGTLGLNGLARTSAETFDFGTYTLGSAVGHVEFTFALLPA